MPDTIVDAETEGDVLLELATSGKALPDLPNKKDRSNWVEESGGLPPYIDRIAKHLHSEEGMTVSAAIASAVNTVKRWATGGAVRKNGGPKVTKETQAEAAKALAEWKAKAAKAKADLSGVRPDSEVDHGRLALALNQERAARGLPMSGALELAAIRFDPQKHPRDLKGQFRKTLGSLKQGSAVELPDGTRVTKDGGSYNVSRGGKSGGANIKDADAATNEALAQSARSRDPRSLGGAKSFNNVDKAIEDAEIKEPPGLKDKTDSELAQMLIKSEGDPRAIRNEQGRRADEMAAKDLGDAKPKTVPAEQTPQEKGEEGSPIPAIKSGAHKDGAGGTLREIADASDDLEVELAYDGQILQPKGLNDTEGAKRWTSVSLIQEDDGNWTAVVEDFQDDGDGAQPLDQEFHENVTSEQLHELAKRVKLDDDSDGPNTEGKRDAVAATARAATQADIDSVDANASVGESAAIFDKDGELLAVTDEYGAATLAKGVDPGLKGEIEALVGDDDGERLMEIWDEDDPGLDLNEADDPDADESDHRAALESALAKLLDQLKAQRKKAEEANRG